jgi:hypothetical protein
MDATALYYTFSTIAQTLAAGFAVLAAFVLFRLQGIESDLVKADDVFSNEGLDYISRDEIWEILTTKGADAVVETLKKIQDERKVAVVFAFPHVARAAQRAGRLLSVYRQTVRLTKWSLCFTVTDIALCLIAIPFVPRLSLCFALSWWLAGATVLLAVVAVTLYARLILILLRRPDLTPRIGETR